MKLFKCAVLHILVFGALNISPNITDLSCAASILLPWFTNSEHTYEIGY